MGRNQNEPPDPSVSGSIETRENLRTNTASKPGSKPAEGCLYFEYSSSEAGRLVLERTLSDLSLGVGETDG